jgi:hypothetical protein
MSVNIDKYAVFAGRPLVMCKNNTMIYGDLNEKAIAEIIMLGPDVEGMLMVTIKDSKNPENVLRANEFKTGIHAALEYACEQIDRYNKK